MVKISKKVIYLMFTIAIIFALIPSLHHFYMDSYQKDLIDEYEANSKVSAGDKLKINSNNAIIESAKANSNSEVISNSDNISSHEDIKESAMPVKTNEDWDRGAVMGYIKIDKIDVNLPVVQGSDLESLKLGVGHMVNTDLPGQVGNCALAGHRSYTYGKIFNRLNEVGVGDLVEVNYENISYIYEIYEVIIVEPTNLSVLDRNGEEKIVTLITCHPIYTADKRMILHGKLVKENTN